MRLHAFIAILAVIPNKILAKFKYKKIILEIIIKRIFINCHKSSSHPQTFQMISS